MARFRVEHRTEDHVVVLGQTDAPAAAQAALSAHAMRLIDAGETGDLVLVDQATGVDVARRSLN